MSLNSPLSPAAARVATRARVPSLLLLLALGLPACERSSAVESTPPDDQGLAPLAYDEQPDELDAEDEPAAVAEGSLTETAASPEVDEDSRAWQARMLAAIEAFKRDDQDGYIRVSTLSPKRDEVGDFVFTDSVVEEPRAAPVLLSRMLERRTTRVTRQAIAEALPRTRGDWAEGASHLIRTEAEASVRKVLVESMRYAPYPHNLRGLRYGFRDEHRHVRAAATRTSGFLRNGKALWTELVSALFDEDAEVRAGAASSLGRLGVAESWEGLVRVLGDRNGEVRFKALEALDRIDHARAQQLPELEKLTRDENERAAALASSLLGRPPVRRRPKPSATTGVKAKASVTVEASPVAPSGAPSSSPPSPPASPPVRSADPPASPPASGPAGTSPSGAFGDATAPTSPPRGS